MSNADVKKEILAVEATFKKNANAPDPAAVVRGFYAKDAILIPAGSPKNVKGQKALTAFWQELLITEKAKDITVKTVSTGSGELAYEIGEFGYTTPGKRGKETRTAGKYLVLYRKEANGYKAIVDIFNVND